MNAFPSVADLWSDPRLIYAVAIVAVLLLAITIWLFRRRRKEGRAAGVICLILSIALHGVLIYLVPYQEPEPGGGPSVERAADQQGVETLSFSTFDPDLSIEDAAGDHETPVNVPLPIAELDDLLSRPSEAAPTGEADLTGEADAAESLDEQQPVADPPPAPESPAPESLADAPSLQSQESFEDLAAELDDAFESLMQTQEQLQVETDADAPVPSPPPKPESSVTTEPVDPATAQAIANIPPQPSTEITQPAPAARSTERPANVPGSETADFANRVGAAKQEALNQTGGDAQSEAAVKAALRFLADAQRRDGAWDPVASGAGQERMPLGEVRSGAGTKCTTALTGLALLAMMGSGHTHHQGDYAENVYRGLAYLIQNQNPDGSLSGSATIYAASYCHSMAALAMCEAAVMTKDPSAIECARRAIAHTQRMQHPVTGGWRYTRGDPGDLSQLGWQAMVLDGGKRSGIAINPQSVVGVSRFLRSVRAGRGGLACYRPGEAISRTMTAEALATRLLIGEDVPKPEIREAEGYLMESLPGSGIDNYYYWYYATLALHQLQDDAWQRWNQALKQRLIATQRPDGSWPSSTLWGGYGGTVYTTSMAALCLETYYRHALRDSQARIANRP